MNILVVDDEKEIADLVELYLQNEGYNVYKFYEPKSAIQCVENERLDLAILDIMLPEIDGFELCKIIREKYNYPIIMLTAKVQDIDKITGLSIGADDYITKPFNPLELVARVKASLRRYTTYNKEDNRDIIDFKGLVIDKNTHICTLYDKEIELTPLEFSILLYLCENRGRAISSVELYENIWKDSFFESNNTIMVHIRRIREKLNEDSRNPKFIKTIWGVGYKVE